MKNFDIIYDVLNTLNSSNIKNYKFPPTEIFSEGWMLRLTLNWFYNNPCNHPLAFDNGANWYSEALLTSKFKRINHNDKLAEAETHADGVIGNFEIGNNGKGDLKLMKNGTQFVVCEAKMFSSYSKKITNSPNYNQVARTVACMCNIITSSNINLSNFNNIGFYGIMPESKLNKEKTFEEFIKKFHIKETVNNRIEQYRNRADYVEKKEWFNNSFIPFLEKIKIESITWESIINFISDMDLNYGIKLRDFYNNCIEFNKPKSKSSIS